MKIILDNVIFSNVAQGGVSNYWFELSKHILQKEHDNLLFYEEPYSSFNFHRKQLLIPENKIIRSNSLFNSSIKRRLSSNKIDTDDYFLYHSSYYRPVSGDRLFSEITTIHDFTHNYYSNFLKRVVHNKMKYGCIKRSKGIICISENTYNDLKLFCPPKNNQQVAIIHNGVSDDFYQITDKHNVSVQYLKSFILKAPYIVYIGSRVNYKNFLFVVAILKEIPNLNLVIVGPSLSISELKLFDKESLERTTTVKNMSNFELNILYNFAHALIYPSSYEGFGIPIIEAMKAGCPVLALKNSSIVEVSGDAAILFKDLNVDFFKKALKELYNLDFRKEVIEKGINQSKKFSWDKCLRETYEFYQEVY
jgi:mannosyltransferase